MSHYGPYVNLRVATGQARDLNRTVTDTIGLPTEIYSSPYSSGTGIRKIALSTGVVTTIPGSSQPGYEDFPRGIWGNGPNLYVSDPENIIRKLTPDAAAPPTLSIVSPVRQGLWVQTDFAAIVIRCWND